MGLSERQPKKGLIEFPSFGETEAVRREAPCGPREAKHQLSLSWETSGFA